MQFWESHQRSLQWIAEQNREAAEAKATRKAKNIQKMKEKSSPGLSEHAKDFPESDLMDVDAEPRQEVEPYNPYEGDEMAKQLNEPLFDFLSRLKPSATPLSSGPWIWIAYPHAKRLSKCDVAGLKQEGQRLLENFMSQRRSLEARHPDKNLGTITRMMRAAKDLLEEDIVRLARAKNLMNGKWMLFPSPAHVDEVWFKVAKATHAGALGVAAKVATAGDDDRSEKSRLICVYTNDFSDIEDVKHVLRQLKEMNLVRGDQGIFYKCDAYTYLDIMNCNEYRLKASMYKSKDMLKED
jgi:Domain of unknown function (DUF1917)